MNNSFTNCFPNEQIRYSGKEESVSYITVCHLKFIVLKGLFFKGKKMFAVEIATVSEKCSGCGYTDYIHSTNPSLGRDNFMSCFSF